jgi:SAM-dependent methyltransferase
MRVTNQSDGRLTDRAYWENNWARPDGRRPLGGQIRRRYPTLVLDHLLRARLASATDRRFLEVGCGTGKWLIYFHETFGYSVTGCDYAAASCAMAAGNLERAGIRGTVVQADLFALTGAYDVVFSAGLIEHFVKPEEVLEKFVSLLNPGGTLISTVPNLAGVSGWYHRRWKPETFTTHRVVTSGDMVGWYQGLGLQRVEAGAYGSVVPARFPRDKIRSQHPWLYRVLWPAVLRPLTGLTSRGCRWGFTRFGVRLDSERFSPYLYAFGEKR